MRRILPTLLLAAILLGACSPMVDNDLPTALPSARAVTALPATNTPIPTATRPPDLGVSADALRGVDVLVWHGWDGSAAGLFAQMAGEFSLSNKWGIKVKIAARPNLNTLAADVDAALGSPDLPDIVVALPEQILGWKGNVLDLSAYVAQPEFGMDAADVTGAIWEQSNVNGARYGVPAARSARFLFYNQSFARDLGFESAPQSADDFRKQACAGNAFWKQDKDLTNDGYGGLALDVTSNWQSPYSWLAVGGGQVFVDGKFQFNTTENIGALEFISKLRESGCAWQASTMTNYEHFAARRALFISGTLSDISGQTRSLTEAGSADKWTVLPFPGDKPGIVAYGPDYAVLKSNGTRQLAAWLFIRWMLEPENQARWSRGTGLLPLNVSAAKDLAVDASSIPQWVAAVKLIPLAVTYPQTAEWRLADKILADGFYAYSAGFPSTGLEAVLKTMDATIGELIK